MAIGSYEEVLEKGIKRVCVKVLGVFDYHSHLRLRPIIKLAKSGDFENKKILEIGCGRGLNAFEVYKRTHIEKYIGCDFNMTEIERARLIKEKLNFQRLEFYNEDAFEFIEKNNLYKDITTVFLIDVLEHIEDDVAFLKKLNGYLNNNVEYIISVPTKRYPNIFGRRFHEKIGHVRDGYNIEEMDAIMNDLGKKREKCSYNTGLIGGIGAKIFYQKIYNKHFLDIFKILLCYIFMFIDINGKDVSCSMFAVYK